MPKQPRRLRKFIVRAPMTITLCVEVTAANEEKALEQAMYEVDEITPLFTGYQEETDRPEMLQIEANSEEGAEAWFEGIDQNMVMGNGKVTRA